MKKLALAVIVLACAASATAQDISGRALLTFERNDFDVQSTSGFRQSYDLGFQGALTTTSLVRLLFHGDDFRGETAVDDSPGSRESGIRVLQPTIELLLNSDSFRMQLRSDYYDTRTKSEGLEADSTLERSLAMMAWQPAASTQFTINAQRNATNDQRNGVEVVDELATASVSWGAKGLQFNGTERYSRSTDGGYERQVLGHQASLDYGTTQFGGKLTVAANAIATMNNADEKALDGASQAVPIPVAISRGLFAVDDTPADNRDHPFAPYPGLIDGNLETSTGLSLGPDSVSFQNLAIDIGRLERLDEIRIVVRDRSGNPLRNGGGPVTWDAWVSDDGSTWTPLADANTTFNRSLSRYEVTFTQTFSRWFKVVNFGLNAEETLVTEVQGVYHATLTARERSGTDTYYGGGATVVLKPMRRLSIIYNGAYNTNTREYTDLNDSESKYLEHIGSVEFEVLRSLAVRGEYSTREATTNLTDREDSSRGTTGYLIFKPTRQLRVTGEIGHHLQRFDGSEFVLDTRAVHADLQVLRSLSILVNGGTQTQTLNEIGGRSVRRFADLSAQARLTRTLRLLVLASMQRVTADSSNPATALLGATRDNRGSAEFIWRAGRPLTIGARVGYVSGAGLSGFTHRLRAEWYPFEDGALVLGGSFDQDIDPLLDRRATRTVFNPRWLINRWATFDLNYTSVSLETDASTRSQRTLFATLTLSK